MDTENNKPKNTDLLYEELSYKVRGAVMEVSKKYGKGLKEIIYQKALAEEFTKNTYIPDFVIDDKIVLEIKSTNSKFTGFVEQELSYLKASKYELGFLVNFSSPTLYIKRLIYTNDRKPQFRVNQ